MNLYNTSRPPTPPTGCQNSRLAGFPFTLLQSKKARVLAHPTGQALLQPQIAEQLSDWVGGNQGRAAKETAEGRKAKNKGRPNACIIIFTHKAFNRPAVNIVRIHPQWVEVRKLNKYCSKSNKQESKGGGSGQRCNRRAR